MIKIIENVKIKKESKYNPNVSTSDELYTEIQKLLNNARLDENGVSLQDLFNCFSFNELKNLYDYLTSEYEYEDDWDYEE